MFDKSFHVVSKLKLSFDEIALKEARIRGNDNMPINERIVGDETSDELTGFGHLS